jgi:hypothetical protein
MGLELGIRIHSLLVNRYTAARPVVRAVISAPVCVDIAEKILFRAGEGLRAEVEHPVGVSQPRRF